MAASELALSANTITTDGTLQTMFTAITTAFSGQLVVDCNAMALGDIIELSLFTMPHTGGTARQEGPTYTIAGLMGLGSGKIWRSPAILSPLSYTWKIKRVAGTDRAYPFSVHQV